jgi:cyclopropane fatty-acyl-phospholipid synthase-like methyltransferase
MLAHLPDVQYVGFDMDEKYIQSAIERFGSRGKFFCRKVSEQVLHEMQEEKFDIVTAIGVVHHLDDAEAVDLFRLAHNVLRPGGMLVTRDGCYTPEQSLLCASYLTWIGAAMCERRSNTWPWRKRFRKCTPTLRQDLLRIPIITSYYNVRRIEFVAA